MMDMDCLLDLDMYFSTGWEIQLALPLYLETRGEDFVLWGEIVYAGFGGWLSKLDFEDEVDPFV